jgi:predicted enzyme related to lactoylglutathione lyase
MSKNVFRSLLPALVMAAAMLAGCNATSPAPAGKLELSDEPLLGKFVWHDLVTDDVEQAQRFYGGLLGWEFERTTHPRGGDYTLIRADGHYLGGIVWLADPAGSDYSRWLPYLSVADVDAAVRATQSAGGAALIGPLDLGNIGRAAAVTDPQGAVLGLLRSRVGDPVDSLAPAPGRVVWNELLAADEAGAVEFYTGLAGLEAATLNRRGGQYTVLQAQGRERAGIMARPDERLQPLWLTHFAVADVAAAARRAAELGGTVLLAPAAELREGTLAVVTDPTGAILALQQQ